MKKFFVIFILFALPLVAYLFFASGVNNFAKLPVLTSETGSLDSFETSTGETLSFRENITILGFPGEQPMDFETNAYHLAEKIYQPYYEFKDFQFVFVVPDAAVAEVEELKEELSGIVDLEKWKFVTGSEEEIRNLFSSLGTNLELDEDLRTPNVFIVDKNGKLRGRSDDEDEGRLFGYDSGSVGILNNKMVDDVKVILAEYRLELKKYNKEKNWMQ